MAKKIEDSLVNSKGIKLKKEKKEPKPKKVSVEQLHPKVSNKDSLTENIQSRSSKSAESLEVGKSKRIPLDPRLGSKSKSKK